MIRVSNLRKAFRTKEKRVAALDGISFDVDHGQFFTLLGPSGCGKTTTLRCIAGLERPDDGEILLGDRKVFSYHERTFVPANKRGIGMVFQSYAIWPHMTVFKNVAYPLKAQYRPQKEIQERVKAALQLVGMEGFEDRLAPRLSGGQQQRVALARALVAEPQVLLLDEPLSNLDAKLRKLMREELKELQMRLGMTTLYVTHDQSEALAISDQIGLMNEGRLIQMGTPVEIYGNPTDEFAAGFIGATNLVVGERIEGTETNSRIRVRTSLGELWATQKRMHDRMEKEILVAFRPEEVFIFDGNKISETDNILKGEVAAITYLGDSMEMQITIGKDRIGLRSSPGPGLKKGNPISLRIPAENCLILPRNK